MKSFISFCKKELLEYQRNYKLFVMLAAFFIFGLMSPVLAKILPELLSGSEMEGMSITMLAEPTALDSLTQFFENIGQLGMLTLIIVYCGISANDLSNQTLVNMLTKGLNRTTVILSKFVVATLIWTISYLVAFFVTYGYTIYFWGGLSFSHLPLALIAPWLFGLFLLALMILGGICFKSFFGSLILTGGIFLMLSLLGMIPSLQKFSPLSLSSGTITLLNGAKKPEDFLFAFIICIILIIISLAASVWIFRKKEL